MVQKQVVLPTSCRFVAITASSVSGVHEAASDFWRESSCCGGGYCLTGNVSPLWDFAVVLNMSWVRCLGTDAVPTADGDVRYLPPVITLGTVGKKEFASAKGL
ncbi:hypothetical protein CBR_g23060 [Chara braunii]|uniref:Uncharacterized protein n=1 Tax=Chara braunii TaxID=69332 RepID=A0A388L3G0_CHABU|nr:hypothetical protein CBR_g23060 [Chara braunii]|eukprot:GBG76845.1 hypothetical protein CBR_g23060 [Chara braunii]